MWLQHVIACFVCLNWIKNGEYIYFVWSCLHYRFNSQLSIVKLDIKNSDLCWINLIKDLELIFSNFLLSLVNYLLSSNNFYDEIESQDQNFAQLKPIIMKIHWNCQDSTFINMKIMCAKFRIKIRSIKEIVKSPYHDFLEFLHVFNHFTPNSQHFLSKFVWNII